MRPRLLLAVGLLAFTIACKGKPPAGPSDPPQSPPPPAAQRSTGPIAFVSDRDGSEQIYLANEDGSAVTRLTPGGWPTWSPDGQRLAFHRRTEGIHVINVDGSGLRYLVSGLEPDWSPDGRSIVFRDPTFSLSTVEVNGSNVRRVYDGEHGALSPAWSPDGQRIAFAVGSYYDCSIFGLFAINADGSRRQLINCDGQLPAWSPSNSEIAFENLGRIDVSNADGSGLRTRVAGPATFPHWTPDGRVIFTTAPAGNWYGRGQRVFISDGGVERQLIPEAVGPALPSYSDRQATWRR